MEISKEDILKNIERAEAALGKTDREGIKAALQKQIAQMKSDLAALEKETAKKEEKIEQKEQEAKEDYDAEIEKIETLLKRNLGAKMREAFEKKLKEAKVKKAAMEQEAKTDKAEAKQELKEVKEAVKDLEKAVATGRTEPIKKPKIEEKKREDNSKKRIKSMQQTIAGLTALVSKVQELKDKYTGQRVDLKRDAGRPAKPFGYRFTGKGKNAYKVPSPAEIKAGKKRGTIDYEGRPNRSDVYPKGYQGNVREKLADGGKTEMFEKPIPSFYLISDDGYEVIIQPADLRDEANAFFKKRMTLDELKKLGTSKYNAFIHHLVKKGYEKDNGNKYAHGGGVKNHLMILHNKENGTYLIRKLENNKGETVASKIATKAEAVNKAEELSKKYNLPIEKSYKTRLAQGGETDWDIIREKMREKRDPNSKEYKKALQEARRVTQAPPKPKRAKYEFDYDEESLTGERAGERRAEIGYAKGGKISAADVRTIAKSINKSLTDKEVDEVLKMYPSEQKNDPSATWDLVIEECIYNVKPSLSNMELFQKEKMAAGGKAAKGGFASKAQANLDKNKNGRLDKEDFQIIRGEKKMADGGKTKSEYTDEEIFVIIHGRKPKRSGPYFTLPKRDFEQAKDMGFEYDDDKDAWVTMKNWNDAPYGDDDNSHSINPKGFVKSTKGPKKPKSKSKKMAKGGKAMRKNSPSRFCWTKDAVKDGIIKKENFDKAPSRYQRKTYPAYIIEK